MAGTGRVSSLYEENELILVAASRGEVEIFKKRLGSNPELAKALDSQQRSLLHLASANGHIEIVKELTKKRLKMCLARDRDGANPHHVAAMRGNIKVLDVLCQDNPLAPEMCLARDRDGENPLHVAAMKGMVVLLEELFLANPHAARARVDGGERETILHLCVKYNQPEFLNELLIKYFKDDEFVNLMIMLEIPYFTLRLWVFRVKPARYVVTTLKALAPS